MQKDSKDNVDEKRAEIINMLSKKAKEGDLEAQIALLESSRDGAMKGWVCDLIYQDCVKDKDLAACVAWLKHCS